MAAKSTKRLFLHFHKIKSAMKTIFKHLLLKAAHSFFKNQLKKSQDLITTIPIAGLDPKELAQLGKFHLLFF